MSSWYMSSEWGLLGPIRVLAPHRIQFWIWFNIPIQRINCTLVSYVHNYKTKLQSLTHYPLHVDSHELVYVIKQGSVIIYQYYPSYPSVTNPTYYVINWHTLALRSICQIPLKKLLWPQILWSHILYITQIGTLSQSHEISWCLYWEYMFSPTSINNNLIYRDIWLL